MMNTATAATPVVAAAGGAVLSTAVAVPQSLKDALQKKNFNVEEFSKIYAIVRSTHNNDAVAAAAAALVVAVVNKTPDSLSTVLDIMTEAFPQSDWSFPEALLVLRGQGQPLASFVPADFWSGPTLERLETALRDAVTSYTEFLKLHVLPAGLVHQDLMKTWKLALVLRKRPREWPPSQAYAAAVSYVKRNKSNSGSTVSGESTEPPKNPPEIDTIDQLLGPSKMDNIDFVYAEHHVPDVLDWSSLAIDENVFYTEIIEPVKKQPRGCLPIVYSDEMELNEWAVRHFFVESSKTIRVRGLLAHLLKEALPKLAGTTTMATTSSMLIIQADGSVESTGILSSDQQVMRVIITVLYEVLEVSTATQHRPESETRAFLAAAALAVLYASVQQPKATMRPYWSNLRLPNILEATQCTTVRFLLLPRNLPLPRKLRQKIESAKETCLDTILWEKGGEAQTLLALKPKAWPPRVLNSDNRVSVVIKDDDDDAAPWNVVMVQLLAVVEKRLKTLLKQLGLVKAYAPVMQTFQHTLVHHPQLLWNRHLDVILMSCIYGVSRTCGNDVKFTDIIDAYVSFRGDQRVARHIQLKEGDETGNIIAFYNQVFVPDVRTYLLDESNFAEFVGKI